MDLFIDTNIFLSFYHLSSDDLEELRKLSILVREGEVKLLLPDQVITEFQRNRANKIADALKRLREQRLNLQFPQLCRDYEEYERLRQFQKEYEKHHTQLIERIEQDVSDQKLKADSIIKELFQLAATIPTSNPILERARLRMDVGNPPGKKGSLGDAIIWEALLETVPEHEDLYFITDDQDYFSPLDADSFDPFLLGEWTSTKGSQPLTYKRLSSFFKDKFPDIRLASELEKDLLIRELANSPSFAQTHVVIAKLSRHFDFTPAQINEIVSAAVTNNQIHRIVEDLDVKGFLTGVIRGREHQIDPDNLRRLRDLLRESDTHDDIPF